MGLVDLNLTEVKLLYNGKLTECGISINDGKIVKIGKVVNLPKSSDIVSGEGKLVLPGLIDAHVHLRDLDFSYKEDFFSGTCAAAVGGFTTVLDMPNTKPPTNNPRALMDKISRARSRIIVNVGFYGGFPTRWEEFDEMARLGMVAFKANLLDPITELDLDDDTVLLKALHTSAKLDRLVAFHAEDRPMVDSLKTALQKNGDLSLDAYLRAHRPEAEVDALKRILLLNREARARIHISHVTTAKTLALVRRAKREGIKITCEVTPHHLLLNEKDLHKLGSIALTDPPVRQRPDMLRMWDGLNEGVIDIVASDHAPHLLAEKKERDIWRVPAGIPGLETTFALIMTRVNRGEITLSRFTEVLCEIPSKVFNLKGKGAIKPGYDADLIVVDAKKKFTINSAEFYSKAKYSPFDGYEVSGRVIKTFVRGNLVAEEGDIVAKPGSGCICLT